MPTRHLLSPAKVNLTLRIVGRRDDGYHLLESLVVPIDLYDRLDVDMHTSSDSRLTVASDSAEAPPGPQNLIFQAADLFRCRTRTQFSLSVRLRKVIPVGRGLGGGSSNAAGILWFLNQSLGSPLATEQLADLALEIGADVPFFIFGTPALVAGVGERVARVTALPRFDLVVCSPDTGLATGEVYAEADRSLTTPGPESNIADFVDGRKPIRELLTNDLEAAAARICPEVATLKRKLLELGALGASMTGSGSAVFGIFADGTDARRAAAELEREGRWARATSSLGRSWR